MRVGLVEGATLSVLAALATTTISGYRFGDSNHGITVPILKRLMDPTLYPGDVMVATADRFPTVFYRALGAVLPSPDWIPAAFFTLYIVAIAATLAGAYRIGCWAGGPAAGVVTALFAFPVRVGLAGEALYRAAFSHSHLASALTIWAIVWFLEGRRLLPLLVLSLGAYNHALYSAYALVPMSLVVLWEWREVGTRRTLLRLSAAVIPLMPLGIWVIARASPMTAEWLALLRLRSSHHSFPSYFGGDLPDAAALLALALLGASRLSLDRRRLLALFLVGTALLFVLGSFFTEWTPLKAVLQLQPHRSWRFLLLLLYGVIAAELAESWRHGGLARLSALVTGLVMFSPGLEALRPLAVVLQAFCGRPSPAAWSRFAVAGLLISVSGWGDRLHFEELSEFLRRFMNDDPLTAAGLAIALLAGIGLPLPRRRIVAGLATGLTLLWFAPGVYAGLRPRWEEGRWRATQDWVRLNTPASAVILTPPHETGFRVFSERTVVAEWKDGTQQYFDDGFVMEWAERIRVLGDEAYAKLSDEELRQAAYRYQASYIVLPARRRPRRELPKLYDNGGYAVYAAWPRPGR